MEKGKQTHVEHMLEKRRVRNRKLGHISCSVIKHTVIKGLIEGIDLDLNSMLDFCEACTKAKSACQPFPKESETRAEKFGK